MTQFTDDIILDCTKFRTFTDYTSNISGIFSTLDVEKNIVGEGENAGFSKAVSYMGV